MISKIGSLDKLSRTRDTDKKTRQEVQDELTRTGLIRLSTRPTPRSELRAPRSVLSRLKNSSASTPIYTTRSEASLATSARLGSFPDYFR